MEQSLSIHRKIRIADIDGVIRVYNGRNPGSQIHYGSYCSHHELIYKYSGDSISYLDGHSFALNEGSILYIPQGNHGAYSVETLRKGEAIDILFTADAPLAPFPFLLPAPHKTIIIDLFEKCHETWRMGTETKQLRCLSFLYSILAELQEESLRQRVTPRVRTILETALSYFNAHCFDLKIDYAVPARSAGVSYSYLKKLFIAEHGMPPSRYITQRRMEYARTLLMSPEISISEISRLVGYANVYYFSRVFHEEVGMSPTEYRKGI